MNRFKSTYVIFSVLVFLIGVSCSSRKNKLDRSNLIPPDDLTEIITDLYVTDGLLIFHGVHNLYSAPDSMAPYRNVIEKHGYTQETMDKTIRFYIIKKPKKLLEIYDEVLAKLSEMESRFDKESILLLARTSNIWTGKEFYIFPDPSGSDSTDFDILFPSTGGYTFTFTMTMFPDDQSFNPRMTAYTCNPDSLETGKREDIKTLNFIKDGQPHKYSWNLRIMDRSHMQIRGRIYNYDNNPDESGKRLLIEKISLHPTPV